MGAVTRFPDGVTNVGDTADMALFGALDPAKYHVWWSDFDTFTAGDWTVTETQGSATQAVNTGADGGILELVNSGTEDDLNAIQLPAETFKWEAGKDFIIKSRFKISDATQSDLIVGVYITDTSPLASLPSDGLFFYKADGSTSLGFQVRKDGTATTTVVTTTMVADTYVIGAAVYQASIGTWFFYLNGARIGSSAVLTNAPDDEELAVGMAVQNGDGNARTLSADYLLIAKERA